MRRFSLFLVVATVLAALACKQDKADTTYKGEIKPPAPRVGAPIVAEARTFSWRITQFPATMAAGSVATVTVLVTNTSSLPWHGEELAGTSQPLRVGYHWLDPSGKPAQQDDGSRAEIPTLVPPGAEVALTLKVRAPANPGEYRFEPGVVQEAVAWFGASALGKQPPLSVKIERDSTAHP